MSRVRHRRGFAIAIASVCAAAVVGSGARAEVTFTSLEDRTLDEVVAEASDASRLVMLVITQPDWCPPCIRLDRELLRNPDATELRDLTRDWTVLEIHGYDKDGYRLLRDQGIGFSGTPTTLVIEPAPGRRELRAGRLLACVVGYPPDYVDQLREATSGHDPLPAAIARAKASGMPADWMALGDLYAARGQAQQCKRAFQRVLALDAEDLPGIDADSLAVLQREARWANIEAYQRVGKDHKSALHLLDDFEGMYPGAEKSDEFEYARAWSLLADQREQAAMDYVENHFVLPGTLDKLESFLYLAFRNPIPDVLQLAVAEADRGIVAYPEAEASLREGRARVLRRLGKARQAEAEFKRALDLTDPEDPRYPIIEAQWKHMQTL